MSLMFKFLWFQMEKGLQIFDISQLEKIDINCYDFIVLWAETCIFKLKFEKNKKEEFLNNFELLRLREILNGKTLVYVTSLLPEYVRKKYLTFLENLIKILWEKDIEITINDWWIYKWLQNNNLVWTLKLNIWTNLYYHVKDPYAVYYREKFRYISIDKEFYNKFFKDKWFNWYLEVYYPLQGLEIRSLDYPISLYYPFVQYSFTRACPWSLKKWWEKVSRLILSCWGCPKDYYTGIVKQTLKWKDLNLESNYVPNAQYYSIEKFYTLDAIKKSLKVDRVVYNYNLVCNS